MLGDRGSFCKNSFLKFIQYLLFFCSVIIIFESVRHLFKIFSGTLQRLPFDVINLNMRFETLCRKIQYTKIGKWREVVEIQHILTPFTFSENRYLFIYLTELLGRDTFSVNTSKAVMTVMMYIQTRNNRMRGTWPTLTNRILNFKNCTQVKYKFYSILEWEKLLIENCHRGGLKTPINLVEVFVLYYTNPLLNSSLFSGVSDVLPMCFQPVLRYRRSRLRFRKSMRGISVCSCWDHIVLLLWGSARRSLVPRLWNFH